MFLFDNKFVIPLNYNDIDRCVNISLAIDNLDLLWLMFDSNHRRAVKMLHIFFLCYQMLVIAATEPCGLMHSEPPHPIIQTPAFSTPHPSQISASGMSPSPSIFTTSTAFLIQPNSNSNAVDHISTFDNASSSPPLVPNTPETPTSSQMTRSPSQLQSETELTVSSPVSTGPVSPSVSSNTHNPVQLDHDYLENAEPRIKPRMLKCVVKFDRIYQYLSNISSTTGNLALTSMGMYCHVLSYILHIIFYYDVTNWNKWYSSWPFYTLSQECGS